MREINQIVIHCSATKPSMDIGAEEIYEWHTRENPHGNGWSDIGYHVVIQRSGLIDLGRPFQRPGSHVRGHNDASIGICLVGGISESGASEDNFTHEQYASLIYTKGWMDRVWPDAEWLGHRDFPGS